MQSNHKVIYAQCYRKLDVSVLEKMLHCCHCVVSELNSMLILGLLLAAFLLPDVIEINFTIKPFVLVLQMTGSYACNKVNYLLSLLKHNI